MPGETPLQQLGLDSLMALELRNVLAQAFERPFSATLLFDYPTIRGLAQYLLGSAVPETNSTVPVAGSFDAGRQPAPGNGKGLADDLDFSALSDAEAEELLVAELDRKERS